MCSSQDFARWGLEPASSQSYLLRLVPYPTRLHFLGIHLPLLKECGIVTTPGSGFGAPGEGYIRMALTVNKERIAEAVARIQKLSF